MIAKESSERIDKFVEDELIAWPISHFDNGLRRTFEVIIPGFGIH